uniref:Peptidase M12B domain-containing protein n=1 Tax=Pundamilia nyererei TaxID=303518 RepID=A0A3B4GHX5_9CICH
MATLTGCSVGWRWEEDSSCWSWRRTSESERRDIKHHMYRTSSAAAHLNRLFFLFQFYRPLNVRVALTGLEIWSDRDKIRVEKSPTDTLSNFLEWRTRDLLPRLRHDNAQLVMGGSFDGTTVGMASQSSMCSRDRSGGDHLVSVLGVASTVAHELGHNLGMSHDTAERHCSCQNEPRLGGCIMEPSTGSVLKGLVSAGAQLLLVVPPFPKECALNVSPGQIELNKVVEFSIHFQ